MTIWGITPAGNRLLLGEPSEAALSWDRDAPADLFRAAFQADRLWEEISEVELWESGVLEFRGIVDEQNTRISSKGLTVELVCRSLEALLLDSEAPPGAVNAPSLELLEARFLAPLGLRLGEGDRGKKRGVLAVGKGESCWEALSRFCENWLGTVPFVDLSGLVQCAGAPERELELAQVISAEISLLPCNRIGRIWQQSCQGAYDTLYKGNRPGETRTRYFSAQSGKDPKAALAAGERESFLLTVTCAGRWYPGRNGRASVALPEAGRFYRCPVKSALYRRDASGDRTRLVLERGEEEKKEELKCG